MSAPTRGRRTKRDTTSGGFTTTSGQVTLKMPKLKSMRFATAVIERCKRHETNVEEAIIEMYLTGVSIRRIEDVDAYLTTHIEAEGPMTKLVTDVTEFKVGGTKLYLSPVVDLYNDEVVAYSISRPPNMKMVLEMLAGPEDRLDGENAPLLHSDTGWQYQMPTYRLALERMEIAQSMSRKGNCLDNAKIENFFSMVKTELYYDWEGDDSNIFERDLEKYIDWHNNARIKKRLDGSSPAKYRLGRAA